MCTGLQQLRSARNSGALLVRNRRHHTVPAAATRRRVASRASSNNYNNESRSNTVQHASLAKLRLQQLLSGVGDGYSEIVSSHLSNLNSNLKVFMWLNITLGGSLLAYGPLAVVDWLLGFDPIGSTWSLQSLELLMMGVLAAAPLVLLTAVSWIPDVKKTLPLVQEFHEGQVDVHTPLLSGMTQSQMALSAMAAAFSIELLVLPGMFQHVRFLQAIVTQLHGILQSDLMLTIQDGVAKMSIPNDSMSVLMALGLAACVAAGGEAALHLGKLSQKEADVVQEAINNADRYYRVMSMNTDTSAQDAETAAQAFKQEASAWLNRHKRVALMAAGWNVLMTMYLGAVYMYCDNFTTPAVAGMLATLAQWYFLYGQVNKLPVSEDGSDASGSSGQ